MSKKGILIVDDDPHVTELIGVDLDAAGTTWRARRTDERPCRVSTPRGQI
jgi:hypothetical protein